MNKLQQTEFELLNVFVDICDKLNLKYYLVCGTALGAVKYKGFIPWDDDVDVALLREDYEVFIKKAPLLLPEYLFLQNHHTDENFPQIYSKLRNSCTTYIEKSVENLPIHHGVYIDIFPLDGYPVRKVEQAFLEFRKRVYQSLMLSVCNVEQSKKAKFIKFISNLFDSSGNVNHIVKKYSKMLKSYPVQKSDYICNHGNWQGKLEYAPREQYGEGIIMKFEGLDVRVPEQYDAYLTQKYGNWRADLPVEQQVGHHYYSVLDLDNPYTMYLNNK